MPEGPRTGAPGDPGGHVAKNMPKREEVLKEFQPIGKYRIRLMRDPERPGESPNLDIREYISSRDFEGFTRRGIKLTAKADIDLLRCVLTEVLERRYS